MLNPATQSNHIKTSSDILQEFNQKHYGSQEFRPSVVQINHQTKSAVTHSNHNLSNHDAINQSNQYFTPQPSSQIQQQNNIAKSNVYNDTYQSNNGIQQSNYKAYVQDNQSKIQKPNQLQQQQAQQFSQNNQVSNNIFLSGIQQNQNPPRSDNLYSISSRIEEHQRLSQKKASNKLYDSFIGKEKDLESSFTNGNENSKKANQFNDNLGKDFKQMTSREIGQSLLQQEQKRYFSPASPEQLQNIITLKRNRGVYKGQVKQIKGENVLEGIGQMEMFNGDIYMGYFWRNYMHGDGYLLKQNGDFYNGKFQNDKIQGFGRYYYINGDLYEGNFYYGVRQSENAKFYSAAEDAWYEIPFDQDRKHGKGQRKDNQGVVLNVEFFQDVLQTGDNVNISQVNLNDYFVSKIKEEVLYENQPVKEEVVKRTKKEQKPKDIHYQAMQELEGFIKEGLPIYSFEQQLSNPIQGQAIYKFQDGSYYAGNWLNGVFHGFGHYYDSKVGLYKGDFIQGLKNGFADMFYFNGDEYHGMWVQDLKHDEKAQYFKFSKQQAYEAYFSQGNLIKIIKPVQQQLF
ncbi:MORN motif protein (macronuclear) [Tetrahymena thermophila SB210]|uniref:MORN motif protein n=1 Tax=Tetrahymena thermophila (strain SB210) TaxID=312017 RepID=Q231C8_TETTS|nr:MORN motif protein [Tetrahymena thermophila SB210]EAR91111.2 MORN motif protein [Tetrahymena thermophila SB210]|eukprot:XP_001011356.2 MORN motif protein [Tetrahymena thermophila SB210]